MASSSSNFLDGLKFYFITKKLGKLQHKILTEKIKRFGGTVSSHFDRSTTHVLFPREVDYQSGMDSLKSTTVGDTVVLVFIDWLPDCIGERKLVPTAQFQIKPCQVEKCDSAHFINSDPAETCSPVHAKSTPRRIRFPVSGTSKFLGASLVVGKVGKDVLLRGALAYGTTYGIGVFCLTEEGEQQIGWVPENNQTVLDVVRQTYCFPGFRAKIDTATSKTMADKFTKITIYLICELQ